MIKLNFLIFNSFLGGQRDAEVSFIGATMYPILILHGGAGKWSGKRLPIALDQLNEIARDSFLILKTNGALDAVEYAIKYMEKSEIFNAGRGAALNLFGEVELDAGLMTSDGKVGAVASVRNVMHPITLAKIVLQETDHVLMVGEGAEFLAKSRGLIVPKDELISDYAKKRWESAVKEILQRVKGKITKHPLLDYMLTIFPHLIEFIKNNTSFLEHIKEKYGMGISDTVGAVAYDGKSFAAGSSTGGIFLKIPGRVGDTPIMGAGFFASKDGACSATGHGEAIMKTFLCKRAVEYAKKYGAEEGVKKLFEDVSKELNIRAGVILLDEEGNWGVYHTTKYFPVAIISEERIIIKDHWV